MKTKNLFLKLFLYFKEFTFFLNKKRLLILLFTTCFSFIAKARDIDFNAEYNEDGDVAIELNKAISDASSGDVIIFKSAYYDLGGNIITIDKALTFRGNAPVNFNPVAFGASGIQTTLGNILSIQVRSNNVKFQNMSIVAIDQGEDVFDILIDARHSTYLTSNPITVQQLHYTGLEFKNIVLHGSAYSFHSGNGVGLLMENVSMVNWRRIGFWANRLGRTDMTPKMTFNNCSFIPEETIINFDDRGVSFDAGNSEYPVIWGLNDTSFTTCYFENTGIAYSRCEDSTIDGCTFTDEVGAVDLVHIEEFSNNVRVINNVFDCKVLDASKRTRISQLDRDLQPVDNISFTGNRIVGSYNFFISTYAPTNLTVTGNDFTAANAVNNNSIDLAFYEARDREPITGELVSNDITINNNTGLGTTNNKGFRAFFPINNARFTVNGYSGAQKSITRVTPKPAEMPNGVYEIESVDTGEKLAVSSNGLGLTTTTTSSTSSQWRITFKPPYSYIIQNVSNDKFLETHVGYTEFDVITNQPQNIFPFLNTVGANTSKPFWAIKRINTDDFEIFPGGNERQSVLNVNGGSPKLSFTISIDAQGVRSNLPLGDDVKWKIRPVNNSTLPTNNSGFFFIQNRQTGKFIRPQIDTENGIIAQAPSTWRGNWTQWEMIPAEGDYFHLKNKQTGKFLRPLTNADNSAMIQSSTGINSQWQTQWKKVNTSNGYFYLENRWTAKYFRPIGNDDLSSATGNNFGMQLKPTSYSGNYTQWQFVNTSTSKSINKSNTEETALDSDATLDANDISLFPNPARNEVSILFENKVKTADLTIVDLQGKVVYREASFSGDFIKINTSNFNRGLYFVHIKVPDQTKISKLIIE